MFKELQNVTFEETLTSVKEIVAKRYFNLDLVGKQSIYRLCETVGSEVIHQFMTPYFDQPYKRADGDPWTIPLGPTEYNVDNVFPARIYAKLSISENRELPLIDFGFNAGKYLINSWTKFSEEDKLVMLALSIYLEMQSTVPLSFEKFLEEGIIVLINSLFVNLFSPYTSQARFEEWALTYGLVKNVDADFFCPRYLLPENYKKGMAIDWYKTLAKFKENLYENSSLVVDVASLVLLKDSRPPFYAALDSLEKYENLSCYSNRVEEIINVVTEYNAIDFCSRPEKGNGIIYYHNHGGNSFSVYTRKDTLGLTLRESCPGKVKGLIEPLSFDLKNKEEAFKNIDKIEMVFNPSIFLLYLEIVGDEGEKEWLKDRESTVMHFFNNNITSCFLSNVTRDENE